MNLPNKLIMFRLILVPFFVAVLLAPALPHHCLVAAILFAVAPYTDHLDGMLARKDNWITDFGKFMGPLADKVLITSVLVCFMELRLANVWLTLLIIVREFMVMSIRLVTADKGQMIATSSQGKTKTVNQIITILIVLFLQYQLELAMAGATLSVTTSKPLASLLGQLLILVAAALTVISGLIYLKQNWQIVKTVG